MREVPVVHNQQPLLFVPVGAGLGIALYFLLPFEPELLIPTLLFFCLCPVLFLLRGKQILRYAVMILLCVLAGFLCAAWNAHRVASPRIAEDSEGTVWVRGTLRSMESLTKGSRVTLDDLDLWQPNTKKWPPEKTPTRLRVTVHTSTGEAAPGDRVSFKAKLQPPRRPAYPGADDYSLFAYFDRIGGSGFSLTPIKIMEHKNENFFSENIAKLRHHIATSLIHDFNDTAISGIATALLVGDQGNIPNNILDAMRVSGLGHILSISGLHLALVMTGIYWLTRALLALSTTLALRYPIKQWAALLALLGGLAYLLLAGMPVPAVRSYVMAGLFFLAILLHRTGTPMRPVAWSAILILAYEPDSLLGPSFQMSFAAVTALIASYEIFERYYPGRQNLNFFGRFRWYVFGTLFSSFVAGFATTPYALHHFGRYATYGLLANAVGVPLTSFWIMPWGMVALLLSPLGLSGLAYPPLRLGIDLLNRWALWINDLPHASAMLPPMQTWAVALFTLAGLWLCLWRGRIRLYALPFITLSLLSLAFPPTLPDILVDEHARLFAVRNTDGTYNFSSNTAARSARNNWLVQLAQQKPLPLNKNMQLSCNDTHCTYSTTKGTALVIKTTFTEKINCNDYSIVIYLISTPDTCSNSITPEALSTYGTHAIWMGKKPQLQPYIETVEGQRGSRLWTVYPQAPKT